MPIYEYRCETCGQHTEIMQKISDSAVISCPHCHQDTLKRLVSATGFQLKGTGWYVTDFRNKEKPHPEKLSTEKPTTTDKESKQTEKKTETPTNPKDSKTDS